MNQISIEYIIISNGIKINSFNKISDKQINEIEEEFGVNNCGFDISYDTNKINYTFS